MSEKKSLEELLEEELSGEQKETQLETTNQEKKEESQSSPTYKVGNRDLTSDQLFEEYQRLQAEFTRRSQRLSELEKAKSTTETSSTQQSLSPQDQEVLRELKRLGVITRDEGVTKDEVEKMREELLTSAVTTSTKMSELKQALDELEEDFDGTDGTPKVERQKILDFIVQNPNTNLTPLQIAKIVYYDDFVKYEASKLSSNGVPKTETHGLGKVTEPPKARYSFKDGSVERAILEQLG
jgi:signal recognition particle GTPase